MSGLSTHVLDTSSGRPARGVIVTLSIRDHETWRTLLRTETDDDGRVAQLLPPDTELVAGVYRLHFAIGDYFAERQTDSFYPEAAVTFRVDNPDQHFHVPLLLSPWGYSTYRGS